MFLHVTGCQTGWWLSRHEDLSLIPKTHKAHKMVSNPSTGEAETGGSWSFLVSCGDVICDLIKRSHVKKKLGGWLLRNST